MACMPKPMPFRIGVLIIGSLYWDSRRQAWRDSRLKMDEVFDVSACIRYGRLSTGRDNTYTMVFSGLADEGQAKVVRCRHDIFTLVDLNDEAEHLWAAESLEKKSNRVSSGWGCVALLSNPDREVPAEVTDGWAKRVAETEGYGKMPHASGERPPVSAEGLLRISWPLVAETREPVPLDLLIATANHPTVDGQPKAYAKPATIAAAWLAEKAVKNKRVEYFLENAKCGIRTFEDDAIREGLAFPKST